MTDKDLHKYLFTNYAKTHREFVYSCDRQAWFANYVEANYFPFIEHLDKQQAEILEIGCGEGYLLSAFSAANYKNLHAVDLSPDDVEKAKKLNPNADIHCIDALDYLDKSKILYDLILFKDVLEHTCKEQVFSLLKKVKAGLNPNGMIIIDVPNMDWLLAQHERYMDFTHEVGFTRESLAQVLRNLFTDIRVVKGRMVNIDPNLTLKARIAYQLRPFVIYIITKVLTIIGEGASDVWWDCRSIIAIVKNNTNVS